MLIHHFQLEKTMKVLVLLLLLLLYNNANLHIFDVYGKVTFNRFLQ